MRKIYVFYADVFLLQNLCMDYLAVMGSNLFLKRGKRGIRLFLVSALSSLCGLFLLLSVKDPVWYQLLAHFVLNTGMVAGCFGIKSKKQFLENWLATYLAALLLGGGMEWLQEQRLFYRHQYMQMLAASVLLFSAAAYLMQFRSYGNYIFSCRLKKGLRSLELRAYWDSGNQLRDPYTGKAVSILSYQKAKDFWEAERDAVRYVPYRSLGEQNGLLWVTDVDFLEIRQGKQRIVIKNAAIGFAEEGLLEGKDYDMILHAALLDEGERINKKRKSRAGGGICT